MRNDGTDFVLSNSWTDILNHYGMERKASETYLFDSEFYCFTDLPVHLTGMLLASLLLQNMQYFKINGSLLWGIMTQYLCLLKSLKYESNIIFLWSISRSILPDWFVHRSFFPDPSGKVQVTYLADWRGKGARLTDWGSDRSLPS